VNLNEYKIFRSWYSVNTSYRKIPVIPDFVHNFPDFYPISYIPILYNISFTWLYIRPWFLTIFRAIFGKCHLEKQYDWNMMTLHIAIAW